jgi:DNA polymerase elongation subunit (family B)
MLEMGRIEPARRQHGLRRARLSSSALGDNVLKYIHMPGRILIDLMKVVQRDHKLDSYTQLRGSALHR